jgi:hypothetical protein
VDEVYADQNRNQTPPKASTHPRARTTYVILRALRTLTPNIETKIGVSYGQIIWLGYAAEEARKGMEVTNATQKK